MKVNKKQPTYAEAATELESIVSEIESEAMDLDLLSERVKRAAFLINYCKTKLKSTEAEVKSVLKGLEAEKSVVIEEGEETE